VLSAQASVLKRDVISTRDFDKSFADEINRLVENSLIKCMDCGTCSSGCPSGRRTAMRIRQLVRLARLGYKPMLSMVDLWMCTTCYRCFDRCPRKVNITDAIIFIRNKAFKEGYALPKHIKVAQLVIDYGHAVPINNEIRALRKELGLPELPPTVHSFPDALKEVQKILSITKFNELANQQSKFSQ